MQNDSDFQRGVSGIIWTGTKTLGKYGIQLIITYFLARILSPSDFGEVAAIQIIIGFAELFWQLGVGAALVQKKDISETDIQSAHTLNIILGLAILLLVNLFVDTWSIVFRITDVKMLRIYSLVFLLNSLSATSKALAQKSFKYKAVSLITVSSLVIYGVTAITCGLLNFGAWSLVWAVIGQGAFSTILFLVLEPMPRKFNLNRRSLSSLLHFGGGFTLSRIFSYLSNQGDYYVVNRYFGKSVLGIYTKAYQLLLVPVSVIGETLDYVLFPLLSKSQDDRRKLKKVFLNGMFLISIMCLPIQLILYLSAHEIINFFLGESWIEMVPIFRILVVGLFFRTGIKISDSIMRALGQVYSRSFIHAVNAFLVIVFSYCGKNLGGIIGISVGVTIVFILNFIFVTYIVMRSLDIRVWETIKTLRISLIGMVLIVPMTNYFISLLKFGESIIHILAITTFILSSFMVLMFVYLKYAKDDENRSFTIHLIRLCINRTKNVLTKAS